MTTHLRGRAVQAGAFLALVIGGIAVAPAIALASPPGVQITDLSPTEVASGGKVTMRFTVANTNIGEGAGNSADIKISGMDCGCNQLVTVDPGTTKQFTANLQAPTVPDGENRQVAIQIRVSINGEVGNAATTVSVKGEDKPQTVRQIGGKIKDQDGKAISGARVVMRDNAGNRYETTSNGSGGYSFTSSDNDPIVPGKVTVGAAKDGFGSQTVDVQASAGRSVNVPLTLKADATASPSASASPSPSVSATTTAPADDATEAPAAQNTPPPPASTENTAAGQNDQGVSTLFLILGGLLVAAGVGTIVLVMMRRKNSGGDDPDDFGPPGGAGGPMPSGPARYPDSTRVAAPVGGGPADATMVAPLPVSPSLADAPTLLHHSMPMGEDEFPDPYGVPMPQQGSYAGSNNWDNQPGGYGTEAAQYSAGAYGPNGQYVQEPDEDPYAAFNAAPGVGYVAGAAPAAAQRYDEPTGMYRPESTPDDEYDAADYEHQDGYGGQYAAQQPAPTGVYGAQPAAQAGYPADDYDEQAGYDSWGAPGGGIDSGNAYGTQSGGYAGAAYGAVQQQQFGAGYAAEPVGGYAEPTGYDQQGAPYGGYEQQQPAYDEPEYDQRPRGGQPPQRRPPEWES